MGEAGLSGNTPGVLNKAIAMSNIFSTVNTNSLYFPNETRDESLALQLAYELQHVDDPPFSTHVPTIRDYNAAIGDMEEKLKKVSALHRQLSSSKVALERKAQHFA
eukprot:TRINITY_DN156_c0_g1_i8.p4 TRINITY_DN156_c0_g1~~TRINITY_DN156_c0_g1_i8.p4  ORF type:complete len:106 (-),score=22.24 TRINITY_DN156_c0_g1_i8:1055-1372(-)